MRWQGELPPETSGMYLPVHPTSHTARVHHRWKWMSCHVLCLSWSCQQLNSILFRGFGRNQLRVVNWRHQVGMLTQSIACIAVSHIRGHRDITTHGLTAAIIEMRRYGNEAFVMLTRRGQIIQCHPLAVDSMAYCSAGSYFYGSIAGGLNKLRSS